MNYRNLGRTGVKVSPLCLGTMNFGYRTSEPDSIAIIHKALEERINFIDTADLYGQPANDGQGQGITEKLVGKAIKGHRHRIILATKFFAPMNQDDPNARGGSRRHVIEACEASLKRLGTDYIDLYQMHRPDPEIPVDETLRALDDLIRTGKVRYIGTSSFPAWKLMESLWVSKENHLNRFVTEQPRYNIMTRDIEKEIIPMAQTYGVAILAYGPLLGGILSGKYQPAKPNPSDSRMEDPAWKQWAASLMKDNAFEVIEVLQELAREKDCTSSQLAVAWVINQPGITASIIGPRTMAQFEDNLTAVDVEITDEDRRRIDAAVFPGSQNK